MSMLTVGQVLKSKGGTVETVQATETVANVIRRFTEDRIRCLAVTEGDALVGLVTIRDILTYVGRHGGSALEEEIEAVMTRDITSVTPDTSVSEAGALFAKRRFNHLPIQEDGALVGLVTSADVLGRHLAEVQDDASHLLDYISGVYS
jgi:predicted transcriptional regulator